MIASIEDQPIIGKILRYLRAEGVLSSVFSLDRRRGYGYSPYTFSFSFRDNVMFDSASLQA